MNIILYLKAKIMEFLIRNCLQTNFFRQAVTGITFVSVFTIRVSPTLCTHLLVIDYVNSDYL